MSWKNWTKISGLILFIIAITTFYFNFLEPDMSQIEIQSFPASTELDSLNLEDDIEFSFFLYNTGDKAAFVRSVVIDSPGIASRVILPDDLSLDPQEAKDIEIKLFSPQEEFIGSLQITVYYDNTFIESPKVPLFWGGILEE